MTSNPFSDEEWLGWGLLSLTNFDAGIEPVPPIPSLEK